MNETIIQTGTKGLMKIQDNTDGTDKTVDLYIQSSEPITLPTLPWSYTIDGVKSDTRSFSFTNTTAWQHVKKVYVGYSSQFTFHIGDTGTTQLGGPKNLITKLQGGAGVIDIKVGNKYMKAVPYVRVNGVWKAATPMVCVNSQWVGTV